MWPAWRGTKLFYHLDMARTEPQFVFPYYRQLPKSRMRSMVTRTSGSMTSNTWWNSHTQGTLVCNALNISNGVSFWIFLENYHSLGNKYCGKRYKYTHASMLVRSALTAIDHNSNVLREQVTQVVWYIFIIIFHLSSGKERRRCAQIQSGQAAKWNQIHSEESKKWERLLLERSHSLIGAHGIMNVCLS